VFAWAPHTRTVGCVVRDGDANGRADGWLRSATERVVRQAAQLGPAAVPGCGGATFTAWDGQMPLVSASTRPGLARFATVEHSLGYGPTWEALHTLRPVDTDDLISDDRWPRLRPYAVRWGARCVTCIVVKGTGLVATFALFGTLPRSAPLGAVPVGSAIAAEALSELAALRLTSR
jgi:hypothetical protein